MVDAIAALSQLNFHIPVAVDELSVRACACSFCRGHGARTIAHPRGSLDIRVSVPWYLQRYRFGLCTADFLIC
jgi:hypothetical protein